VAVSGEDHGLVLERQAHACQRPQQGVVVAPGKIGTSYGAGEEQVPREQHRRQLRCGGGAEGHRPPGMARGVVDGELQPGQLQHAAVGEHPDVVGFADGQLAHQQRAQRASERPLRVGEHVAVLRVDPGRDPARAADRDDRGDVVDVPVGEQHRDRLQAVLADGFLDPGGGLVAGIDDDALLTGGRGDQVAVGAPGPCGKTGDEHVGPLHVGGGLGGALGSAGKSARSLPAGRGRSRTDCPGPRGR
jgi:hypothetical protein